MGVKDFFDHCVVTFWNRCPNRIGHSRIAHSIRLTKSVFRRFSLLVRRTTEHVFEDVQRCSEGTRKVWSLPGETRGDEPKEGTEGRNERKEPKEANRNKRTHKSNKGEEQKEKKSSHKLKESNTEKDTMTSNLRDVTDALRSSDPDLTHEESEKSLANDDAKRDVPANNNTTTTAAASACPFHYVPLKMTGNSGRTHGVSSGSASLIRNEVSLEDLTKMTSKFYEKAFQDPVIDKFIRSHEDDHGGRFAKWIYQKLSGDPVWDEDRKHRDKTPVLVAGGYEHVVHDRSSAHVAAWYSPKRPSQDVGRHFTLEECRVWMRLHFWAMRESGIMEKSPSFANYYVRFIGHFVRVYEQAAPMFARDSFRWSADPANIQRYLENGQRMDDVMGVAAGDAEAQIPDKEANDFVWPYNKTNPVDE